MKTDIGEARERIAKKFFGMEPGMPEWFAYDSALREMSNLVLDRAIEKILTTNVPHGDHFYAACAPSGDAEALADELRAMKEE